MGIALSTSTEVWTILVVWTGVDRLDYDIRRRSVQIQVMGYDVVVGEVTDQIDGFAVHVMDAVEDVPDRVFVVLE